MMVIDEASKLKNQAIEPLNFMLSAVFHDLGKAVTTTIQPDGKITAYEHDTKGVPICQQQIERLTNSHKIIAYVINMTQLHMRPNMLADNKSKTKKTRMMFDTSVCPEDLILLSKADALGRRTNDYNSENETFLKERLQGYYDILTKPMLSGKDLIQKGFKPGPKFLPIITRARELHFAGLTKEEAFQQIKTDMHRKEKQT
jgi:tRNA nucleotidyltransferase (CCA-adding enzyme)